MYNVSFAKHCRSDGDRSARGGWELAQGGSTSMCGDTAELEDWKETVKRTARGSVLPSRQMSN